MTDIESLCRLTEAVEAAGADIAPTYLEYVQLSFAIATDCGEAGRDFFHRLCRVSPKYQREHAERVFSNALHTQRGEVHLGTAFHLAEATGVAISYVETVGTVRTTPQTLTQARAYNKVANEETDEETITEEKEELLSGSDPQHPLPTLPEANWPKLLQRIIKVAKSEIQRDIMLMGAFTALGACMSRHVRCLYGDKYYYPSLQCFIVAPSASGKGILSYLRLLVQPIHDEIRAKVAEQMKIYKKEKAEYDAMGKERSKMEVPQMPPNKMFLISGNNTGTGILQNIMDSEGTGLIFESEADTLSTAIGSEHGHWSDTLRKAFDHDFLSYNRRGNQEYRETKKVCLSLLMSGTPLQVKAFIPTTEDGGSSRQLYYYMYGIDKWVSQFIDDETDWEEVFNALGLEWKKQLDVIKKNGIHTLQLTNEQKSEIDAVFSELFDRSSIANDREMYSFVARMAINLCRIMSEVAVLRALEHPNPYSLQISSSSPFTPDKSIPSDNRKDGIVTRWNVSISAEDFHAVLNLAEPLYCHAMHILSFLPNTEVSHRPNADRDFLFQQLGKEFTRTELLEKATALGINKSTAITWLKRLTRQGKLISVDGKGSYARACVCMSETGKVSPLSPPYLL